MTHTSLSYCGNQARKFDKERFLCALFAPSSEREKLFTLLAFNYEIAKIRETVTDPMTGLIRLQWWRETVEGIYAETIRNHEVAKPLAELIQAQSLSQTYFDTLLNAREEDLDDAPPATLEHLIAYAEQTSSSLYQLMLEALGVQDNIYQQAATHLGIAWSLTGIMRAMKFPTAKRLMLPSSLLETQNINVDDIIAGKSLERTKPVVKALVDSAVSHLKQADIKPIKHAKPVFLAAVYIDTYLKRIMKADYDLFHTDLEGGHVGTQMKLLIKGLV
jgi:phytoene synthase